MTGVLWVHIVNVLHELCQIPVQIVSSVFIESRIDNGHPWKAIKDWQPMYKGVWDTVANFAPWPLPCPRPGQSPQPHRRSALRCGKVILASAFDRDALTATCAVVGYWRAAKTR
jgi:hypothetical protein